MSLPASFFPLLLMLAAESGSLVGENSADKWRWGQFLDGFLGPALILVGMTFFVLLSLRLKKRNRDLQDLDRRSGSGGSNARMRESLERMAVDLEEVARSISAMLDTRMRALEKLIRDADQRLARLEAAGGGEGGGAEDPAEADARRAADKAEDNLAHHAHIYGLADQGLSVQEMAEQTGYQRGEIELVLSLRRATRPEGE